jgi:transposase-like protein
VIKWGLWRAVDAEGMVLDILVQERRNQEAAETFLHLSWLRYGSLLK